MKYLRNTLAVIGFLFVIGSLIYAVQEKSEDSSINEDKKKLAATKSVNEGYQISAITIPSDLNFAGEKAPMDDPEIMERIDREFLVNTYWQSMEFLTILNT